MKKNPRNKKPDPNPDHPSQRKIPPSKEVKKKERDDKQREEEKRLAEKLRRLLGPNYEMVPVAPKPPSDTLEEDIGNVQQPPPGVKHDSRLYPRLYPYPRPNPRNSGLAGMLNLFRYKP